MKRSEMAEVLGMCQKEEDFLREQGQKEYAHEDDNAFANFDHVGNRVKCVCEHCGKPTRIGRMATLMVYFLKHVDGIIAFIGGHKSQREDVRGRINDVRVYSALLRGMVEETDPSKEETWKRVLREDSAQLIKDNEEGVKGKTSVIERDIRDLPPIVGAE